MQQPSRPPELGRRRPHRCCTCNMRHVTITVLICQYVRSASLCFSYLGSTSFTQASLHPLLRIAARSGSFLLVWSEVHTQHAIQQNLRRLNTPSQL